MNHDTGTDAYFYDDDGRLHTVQAKYYRGGRSKPYMDSPSRVEQWLQERIAEWSRKDLPGMVAVELPPEHVLEAVVGHPDVSMLVWHVGLDEIACSVGTVNQPAEFAFDYGGHRTTPYADAAIPVETAVEAMREFVASGGKRPTVVRWKEPTFQKEDN